MKYLSRLIESEFFMLLRSLNPKSFSISKVSIYLTIAFSMATSLTAKAQWTVPTPEELSMTSEPKAPGASAVYLFREEITVDHFHMYSEYVRLKILTDGGKDRANVELKYQSGGDSGISITDIAGRTIHPDGTIVPFTGKPYERMVVKTQGYKEKAKVFTLPDVTVGSIIEYRYKLRWDDNIYFSPSWIIQNDLYLRKGHFSWRPTDKPLTTSDERGQLTSFIAWYPILPEGMSVKQTKIPGSGDDGSNLIEVNANDVPPSPEEEYMPPIQSLGYRVMFYYSPYRSVEEFWKGEGKHWSKGQDKFIGPGPAVGAAVQQLVSPSDTPEQKLKKLYAAVEKIENTDYTREHSRNEDKAEGLSQVKTTDDIWNHKRGSSDQISDLFVAMARAAGMKAYAMAVTDRSRTLFLQNYLTINQLNDDIAIVNVNGKEQYFDPGSRYCPYGHLSWKHTDSGGLRQTDGGTALVGSPSEPYLASVTNRVANLNMDETGVVTGKVDLKFVGSPALSWRQKVLTDDKDSVEREMKDSVEKMLPANMEVTLISTANLDQYEEPLTASFNVKGPIGSATGKRLLIQGDFFQENSKPTFAHEKRDLAVWFPYRYSAHDAIRINFPPSFQVESVPNEGSFNLPKMAVYKYKTEADGHGVTTRRDLYLAEILYTPKEYPDLRSFYSQFEAKDQEQIILKAPLATSGGN